MAPRFLGCNKDTAAAKSSAKSSAKAAVASDSSAQGASEGRRFLVFLFGIHPTLVDGLHTTIKNQLPLAPKKVSNSSIRVTTVAVSWGLF